MTSPRTVSLLGLPRTGKSTYLGALWMIIQDDRADYIRELDVRGDRSYLTRLGDRVALLEEMQRTDVDSDDGLDLTIELGDLGPVDLRIPDLSGETLRLLVEDRTWHELLSQATEGSDAILLFVHPDRVRTPIRTNFTAAMLDGLLTLVAAEADRDGGDQKTVLEATPEADAETPSPSTPAFTPTLAATAAKMVDAIENLLEARAPHGRLRVGIVVSAWDVVEAAWPTDEPAATPVAWLAKRLPALWQVLLANEDRIEVAAFGVSAIGGRLPQDRQMLEAKGSVLDRAYALDSAGASVPFVAPLEWALG